MLKELIVQNFVIVDRLHLDFQPGMTVITGETGAGKSILLDALEFVLGGRFDASLVRQGANQCDVSVVFELKAQHVLCQYFLEQDLLQPGEDLVLRRILTKEGRSKAYINQQASNLSQLKELGLVLVNLMGQHEHHHFLKPQAQLESLDAYAKIHPLSEEVAGFYRDWQQCEAAWVQLKKQEAEEVSHSELKQFQLDTLREADLQQDELAELDQAHKKLSSVQSLLVMSAELLSKIKEDEPNLVSLQAQVGRTLDSMAADYLELSNASHMWQEAQVLVSEVGHDLQHFQESLSLDPQRLQEIEARLAFLHALARKNKVQPQDLYTLQQELELELSSDGSLLAQLQILEEKRSEARKHYFKAAHVLSQKRQAAALSLEKEVSALMKDLGMPQGECHIQLDQPEGGEGASGIDYIQFLVRINVGQVFQVLKQVASGGELSRIALIMAVLIAQETENKVLIFDEVDVGISGAVAEQVATLIHRLAQHQQILCITHLPQVALLGDAHLHISKRFTEYETFAEASCLEGEARVSEIARMMTGKEVTPAVLQHVREQLQ